MAWSIEAQRAEGFAPAHHQRYLISNILQQVIDGDEKRVIINMPPGSAKTRYTTMLTPPFAFMRHPRWRIIGASHTADLAESFSREIQNYIRDNEHVLEYRLSNEAVGEWRTNRGGVYVAAGVGGAIPGRRADLIIVDDPIKGREAADNEMLRQKMWKWFWGDLRHRLKPSGRIIVMACMTGDTPVLMADGMEKTLRDVRPGDRIATYDAGRISTSTVLNWASQGGDDVFEIATASGIKVRANGRHPFLVERDGRLWWIRLRNLRVGDNLIRAAEAGGSGTALDEIVGIAPAGHEEVFDIQVAGTENFIAGGLVSHNTRWHEDDLPGRLLAQQGDVWRHVNIPAEAGENDPLGRAPGEWLWNEPGDTYGYGAELAAKKAELLSVGSSREWYSQFQGNPVPSEGTLFKVDKLEFMDESDIPAGTTWVRAWDFAATKKIGTNDPDSTVGVKLGRTPRDRYIIAHAVALTDGPDKVEQLIQATAQMDGRSVKIGFPQDPGQAGKAQIQHLTGRLAGYSVESSPESGDKATRASAPAAQVNVGNMAMVRGVWNARMKDELQAFPSGKHDDHVDALSRGFMMLAGPGLGVWRRAAGLA